MLTTISSKNIGWMFSSQMGERDFGQPMTETDLIQSLASNWDSSQGIPDVWEPTSTELDQALADRENAINALLSTPDKTVEIDQGESKRVFTYAEIATAWAQFPVPTYLAVNCHRRGYTMPIVNLLRMANGQEELTIDVKVNNQFRGNEEMRFHSRVAENIRTGRRPYSQHNMLVIAAKLAKMGYGARQLMPKLGIKDGVAQKLYCCATLCNRHPKLDLLNRAGLPQPVDTEGKPIMTYKENGWWPWDKMPYPHGYALLGLSKSVSDSNKQVFEVLGHTNANVPATSAQVEEYILNVLFKDKARVAKAMDRKVIDTIADNVPEEKVRDILEAVGENDRDKMVLSIDELINELETLRSRCERLEAENAELRALING